MGNRCCCNTTKGEATFFNDIPVTDYNINNQDQYESLTTPIMVKQTPNENIIPITNPSIVKINTKSNMQSLLKIEPNRVKSKDIIDEETEYLVKLLYLQRKLKSYAFRCLFEKKRNGMIIEVISFVMKLIAKMKGALVIKAEANYKQFDYEKIKAKYQSNVLEERYLSKKKTERENDNHFVLKTMCLVNEKYLYRGEVNLGNLPNGLGEYYFTNGSTYQGHSSLGNIKGYGRYITQEGTIFEGFFNNLKLEGIGYKLKISGSYYEGMFEKGLKNGKGVEITEDFTYTGNYIDDKKEGQGHIEYKRTGDIYTGNFNKGSINGCGDYTWGNQNNYKGDFKLGKMHGKGKYTWPDGSEYEGDYKNNIKEGFGKFKWVGNRVFIGPFIGGKPHGKGKLIVDGKSEVDATFIEGKLKVEK